jgi:mycothiol synthase
MRRTNLLDLPPIQLPEGYELRAFESQDAESAAETLTLAFGDTWNAVKVLAKLANNDFVKTMFVITASGQVVATASAANPKELPNTGYVHFVATHPDHTGKRLGYWISLATLHEFSKLGYQDAILTTDDFRLPAIRTYLRLGFSPENTDPSHTLRWAEVLRQLQKSG